MRNIQRILTANIVGLCGFVVLFFVFFVGIMLRLEHKEYALIAVPIPYIIGWIYAEKISRWLDD
nr:MAG TPA: hypothetical protein [Caudoviricetes sp.]